MCNTKMRSFDKIMMIEESTNPTSNAGFLQCQSGDGNMTYHSDKRASFNTLVLHKFLVLLNEASKWLLVSASLYGVIWYRDPGAFLCIGCILACFATENVLKPMWNQARPSRAPMADPGMPSSHSLGSFFIAVGWAHIVRDLSGSDPMLLFLAISTVVAALRVSCGYHTIAQVVAGAMIGFVSGHGWMEMIWNGCDIQEILYTNAAVRWTIWSSHSLLWLLFIWKVMSKWIDRRMLKQ